jgi:ATP-dependent Lhr-like helicase
VFQKYDPANLLLHQAQQELLRQELDVARLTEVLAHAQTQQLRIVALKKPSPMAFPLMVERFREKLSNESVADRIARMVADLEAAAGGEAVGTGHEDAAMVFGSAAEQAAAGEALALAAPPASTPRPPRRGRRRSSQRRAP